MSREAAHQSVEPVVAYAPGVFDQFTVRQMRSHAGSVNRFSGWLLLPKATELDVSILNAFLCVYPIHYYFLHQDHQYKTIQIQLSSTKGGTDNLTVHNR